MRSRRGWCQIRKQRIEEAKEKCELILSQIASPDCLLRATSKHKPLMQENQQHDGHHDM